MQCTEPWVTHFVLELLRFVGLKFDTDDEDNDLIFKKLRTRTNLLELAEKQKMDIAMKWNEADHFDKADWCGLVSAPKVTTNTVNCANWALRYEGIIGISNVTYNNWYDCWQTKCEQTGGIAAIEWSPNEEKSDMWSWINTALETGIYIYIYIYIVFNYI